MMPATYSSRLNSLPRTSTKKSRSCRKSMLPADPVLLPLPLPTEVRYGELMMSRRPPDVSVKMPKGIRKMPIRMKFI
jgi:hypothetical protein